MCPSSYTDPGEGGQEGPRGVHALLGAVRGAATVLQGQRAGPLRHEPRVCGGRHKLWLAEVSVCVCFSSCAVLVVHDRCIS